MFVALKAANMYFMTMGLIFQISAMFSDPGYLPDHLKVRLHELTIVVSC